MPSRFAETEVISHPGASCRLVRARDSQSGADGIYLVFDAPGDEERRSLRAIFEALAPLKQQHLEAIHEIAEDEGRLIVRTEQPKGDPVPEAVAKGPLSPAEFRVVARQLLEALAAAHRQGIVHGSLNGARVRLRRAKDAEPSVLITGFGAGFPKDDPSAFVCVPPEQWEQKPARRRSDVYSLGCVLYLALSGRTPFDGKTLKEIRHKHLKHDVLHLAQHAPHAERWMCDWVMSLIQAADDARPPDAGAALASFDAAAAGMSAALPPPLAVPGAPATAFLPTQPQTIQSPVSMPPRLTTTQAPVTRNAPGRPAPPAPRAPGQTARASKPAPAARKSSTGPVASRGSGRKWIIIGGVLAAAAALGLILIPGRKKEPPIKVTTGQPAPQGPVKVQSNPPATQSGGPANISEKYPGHRQKPPAYDRLVLHMMAEAGTVTPFKSPNGQRQFAKEDDFIGAWKDLAEYGRSNELAAQPASGADSALKLVRMKNASNFPLAGDRRFITFRGIGSPPVGLSVAGSQMKEDFPFGKSLPADKRGATVAVVFYQEVRGQQQTLFFLHGKGGNLVLRLGEDGELRLNSRNNSRGSEPQSPTLTIKAKEFHPLETALVIALWRPNPSQVELHLRTATGKVLKAGPVSTPGAPADFLDLLVLGREPLPGPNTTNPDVSPRAMKALYGGIAEVALYATALSEQDRKTLEDQLARHYFPRSAP